MAKHDMPGKPPAGQPHHPGVKTTPAENRPSTDDKKGSRENLKEQGRQGNIHQNTHNQGYQQDR